MARQLREQKKNEIFESVSYMDLSNNFALMYTFISHT